MSLTKNFAETVVARARRDAGFRRALLQEAVEAWLNGELAVGKIVLRNYINATVGFEALARETGIPSKSLMRMFGPSGNPQARNLFDVLYHLQRLEGVSITAHVRKAS
jgi:DNA-binding phage protein